MLNIWFTSDGGIIRYCRRPFSSTYRRSCASPAGRCSAMSGTPRGDEMVTAMIRNRYACVGADDDVYHPLPGRRFAFRRIVERVGDLPFLKPSRSEAILQGLRGCKHLLYGNPDSEKIRGLSAWTSSQPYLEIAGQGYAPKIVLCHYAMRTWNRSHKGARMLFGHSHGEAPPLDISLRRNVCRSRATASG